MEASDYFAVQNLLNRYFDLVDAGDLKACAQLFSEASLTYSQSGRTFNRDPDGLATHMKSFVRIYPDATPRTRHHSGNIIIEADGPDAAKASCTAVIYQGTDTLPFQPIASARYLDTFQKADGVWCFATRRMHLDFTGELRYHLLQEISHD